MRSNPFASVGNAGETYICRDGNVSELAGGQGRFWLSKYSRGRLAGVAAAALLVPRPCPQWWPGDCGGPSCSGHFAGRRYDDCVGLPLGLIGQIWDRMYAPSVPALAEAEAQDLEYRPGDPATVHYSLTDLFDAQRRRWKKSSQRIR